MSKSLGNTYTIPDVVAKGFRPSAVRYLLLSAHYRKQLNFTWASLGAGGGSAAAAHRFSRARRRGRPPGAHPEVAARVEEARAAFADAMQDDLNTAAALGAMFELVRALNSAIDAGELGAGDVPSIRAAFDEFDRVLGVLSPAAGRGRAAAGAGGGDRAARSKIATPRGGAAISPPPTASATTWRPAACCSRTAPAARAGSGK